ncbi:MFS transporter [Stenotrophomonas rhizophila]|uniref:MFS transporter n=1 Tax=Stenotrophomonas rhizophila TaxID=216778 RepID=UPI002A6B6745|nr:MFS transporter [Stenotrophomonas rhizophila]MDY0953220.1 MFS transporter [Stenotrophomonas rhizophila]
MTRVSIAPSFAPRPWLAVVAAGLATFSVVTTEMLPVGLLSSIAEQLGTRTGTVGLTLSLPALLAALFAPIAVIGAGGIDRRGILAGLLALLVVANLASALAVDIYWLLAARVLVGFCMGGIWAIAGGLAARLVPAEGVGLATSIIFGGVAAASVLGVPLGTWVGDLAGWRWAFAGMALFSAAVLALHLLAMPALPVASSPTLRQLRAQLGNRVLQAGLLLTLLLVGGHFMTFTFVRPLLVGVAGIDPRWMGAVLFGYGIAGIGGNFLAGTAAARRTAPTVAAIALGLLLTPVLFLTLGDTVTGGTAVLLVWGLAYGGVSVALMTWVMRAAPHAVEMASALYVGVFNVGIALGSWSGGQLMDGPGLSSMLWTSTGCAGAALILAVVLTARGQPPRTETTNAG